MDQLAQLDDLSHRRYNPLNDSWVLVSPHRTKRPWQGAEEEISSTALPSYDPTCYLCPTNTRANGEQNPAYDDTFVFTNDFSAVKEVQPRYQEPECAKGSPEMDLLRAEPATGKCYVICFKPRHNATLADLSVEEICRVVETWTSVYWRHLAVDSPLRRGVGDGCANGHTNGHTQNGQTNDQNGTKNGHTNPQTNTQLSYMQIFENKGSAMGCSNPHPHGQIWTTSFIPSLPLSELRSQARYLKRKKSHLLADYAALELQKGERVVYENAGFVVLVPWWACWPFEVLVLPKRHKRALTDFTPEEREMLARAMGEVVRRYDNLFECSFPYTMGVHQAPLGGSSDGSHDSCCGGMGGQHGDIDEMVEASYFHIHFYPPLLRSATVRKFMVGFEMAGEPQRDITPEFAAKALRNCGGELYRNRDKKLTTET